MARNMIIFALALVLFGIVAAKTAWTYVASRADDRIAVSAAALAPEDAGLVLGAASRLKDGRPNPYFTNRMVAAAALFRSGKVKYLIVSGGQAQGGRAAGGYDEPTDMKDALVAAGVPASRIYRDYAGFRTLDSVVRAKRVFGQDHVILVSQPFHLERALYLARGRGIDAQGLAAGDVPLSLGWPVQLREAGARLLALVDVLIDRAPRFGGKPVRLGLDAPT